MPDWVRTVTGTSVQLYCSPYKVQFGRSDVMQVVARYTEDRSVDVRHVAVETLSGAAGER